MPIQAFRPERFRTYGMLMISDIAVAEYTAVGAGSIEFGQQNALSSAGFKDVAAGYAGAGWYSAAAVPEPTSGLLMLLGMAGLALRRKRA